MSESEGEGEEEGAGEERRGSLPFLAARRGSKLQDLLKYNQEKRRRGRDKPYRDKQGFVWRRMVPDEELPVPRAPQPHLPSQLPPPRPASQHPPPHQPNIKYISQIPSIDVEYMDPQDSGDSRTLPRDGSLPPEAVARTPRDPDTCSLRSVRSENSFQTCSSEPQLNLVPRQVADTYDDRSSNEERKPPSSALRMLKQQQQQQPPLPQQQHHPQQQQHFSALNAVTNNGSVKPKHGNKLQNKTVR